MQLIIDSLQVAFTMGSQSIPAVQQISMRLAKRSKTAIIGESGCGKSVLTAAVTGLLPENAAIQGTCTWESRPLSPALLTAIRGKELALIPQNPLGSLNPVLTAGFQVSEAVLRTGSRQDKAGVYDQVLALFDAVGFVSPQTIYQSYPHQLSGGMAQRVLLAAALAGRPQLIMADEPTKGLDRQTRNQNVLLLHRVLANSTLLLITHDLEVAATCSEIMVMYAGEIIERGPAEELLTTPRHPYTQQLLSSHPAHGLIPIPGTPPNMSRLPAGCRFAARCALREKLNRPAEKLCLTAHPPLEPGPAPAAARCWHA